MTESSKIIKPKFETRSGDLKNKSNTLNRKNVESALIIVKKYKELSKKSAKTRAMSLGGSR